MNALFAFAFVREKFILIMEIPGFWKCKTTLWHFYGVRGDLLFAKESAKTAKFALHGQKDACAHSDSCCEPGIIDLI